MRLPMPRDLKEPEGWRFSSLRNMRLGVLGQHCGGRLVTAECSYHPAALDKGADSIIGVATHGMGRSGDGRLPITEEA